jgi:ribosomal protein S18 acetylase RimI-like enzyme
MGWTQKLLTDAYTSIEFQFLQKHPEAVNDPKEFLWHPLAPLFENGAAKVDWGVVKSKVVDSLQQLFAMNFSEHIEKDGGCMFHVVAKDVASAAPLGVMQCLISSKYAEGDVRVNVLGVAPAAQRRGLGLLLMGSVLKMTPQAKRIFLSTRTTNANAIKAYSAWGFTQDHKHEGCEYLSEKYWVSFEYVKAKSCVLQRVAEGLRS